MLEGTRILGWTTTGWLRYRLARHRYPDRQQALAAALRSYLLHMGPLYIKAGQVLGTQSGVLSTQATNEFRSFFSELPPMSERALRRTLRTALPMPVEEAFQHFDWQPLAVGSVAQVHRAELHDGREVAVKVVKRGVRERLLASSWLLHQLLRVAHAAVPHVRKYDLPAHFAELRPLLTGQSNLRQEAALQAEIAENFRNHPFLRVPLPHVALCSRDVLVMDYLAGTRGQDPEQADFPRRALAQRLQDAFYTMAYLHGLFHVDPHPGNVFFGRDGSILLLDYGLVGRLSEDAKWNLASFYYACMRRQWTLAAERFTTAFVSGVGASSPAALRQHPDFGRELEAILRTYFEVTTSRWSTMEFVDDTSRLLRSYGARMSTEFSLLALAFLTGEGFIAQVDPDIDIWRNARRFTDRFSPYMSEQLQEEFERDLGSRMPVSMAARRDAASYLVAPTHLDRFVLPSAFPLIIREAAGSKIWDLDGNEYVDLSCGYGPHILGYGHPAVVAAIGAAAARGGVNALGNPSELELASRIAEAFPDSRSASGSKVILSNSGTESVLMALRLARAYTGRDRVAKFEGHYHGFSDQGTVSSWFRFRGEAHRPLPVANSAGSQRSVVDDTLVLQYGDPISLDRIAEHAGTLACVVLEPMPSALGAYDSHFLRQLRAICDRSGVLLVFDEVVTGFRVTYGGVQHLAGVTPDLTCLGKIIGGGLPCGAVVGSAEVINAGRTTTDPFRDVETRAFVGGTMSGNSVTAAAGVAVLDELRTRPEIYAGLRQKTAKLTAALTAAAHDAGAPCIVKGGYSVFSITFDYAQPKLVRDRLAGTNMKANIALAYYLRRHSVYMPELHTMMLSDAHSLADLAVVARGFRASLHEMADNGFFTG